MTKLYGPKDMDDVGYYIDTDDDGFFWVWREPGEPDDIPYERFTSKGDALRDAADDWSSNGNPGLTGRDPLTGTLRRLASNADKEDAKK